MSDAAPRAMRGASAQAGQSEWVAVLDFGAQYSQLIARKVREQNVYCEIISPDTPAGGLAQMSPAAIILSGGPASVYEDGAPSIDPAVFELGIPVLGICYGQQLMAHVLGGVVEGSERKEYGRTQLEVVDDSDLFRGLGRQLTCWMSHGDRVVAPPPGFAVIARSESSPVAAMSDRRRRLYGVQFHPEVVHTPWGPRLVRNFLEREVGCSGTWRMSSFIADAVEGIRERVGDRRALCALSGGVDSAVTAALVRRAIRDRLTCVFVDHGLLRKGEAEAVCATFGRRAAFSGSDSGFVYVDAAERFLTKLRGVTDPETKRRVIGEEFIRVFEDEARKLGTFDFLAQGTLYPDVIESGGSQQAATIKTHHNVGALPEAMQFEVLEPLRYLFKDEVRKVGEELELPREIVWRQPFPGPGLAVRIIGEVTPERLHILREADAIFAEELCGAGLEAQIAQSFAVLAAIRSVGVMGDQRSYEYPIILRAVETDDFMTADWVRIPHDVLGRTATRIVNEVPGVNRVLYDISTKPPATVEWE